MSIELHITDDSGRTRMLPIQGAMTLGRSGDCDLVLSDPEVSGRHCTIWIEHGLPWIRDLDSRNGTFVGDQLLARAVLLEDGAVIRVGNFTATIRAATSMKARSVALALFDQGTGVQHLLRSDRFIIGPHPTADLRVEGVDMATLVIHPHREVWLGDEELPLGVDYSIGSLTFQIREVPSDQRPTVDGSGERYPYQVAVDLNGSTGPVCEVLDPNANHVHTIDATNRAVLMYVLAKKWTEDRDAKIDRSQRGWCSDDDLILGVWGKAALVDGAGKLKALLHRLRSELRDGGFDPWFIEKKRGCTRIRVATARV